MTIPTWIGNVHHRLPNILFFRNIEVHTTMTTDMERIRHLLTYSIGDEKHDPSTHSTLDVLWVLYDRILRYDPKNPRSEERDRFVLSKGHGARAFYTILADKGFFPVEEPVAHLLLRKISVPPGEDGWLGI